MKGIKTGSRKDILKNCVEKSNSRFDLWIEFINVYGIESMAEIGVFRGGFASKVLEQCGSLKKYYMIDPWKNLEGWNKPGNKDDQTFQKHFDEVKRKTDFASEKRIILKGKTTEVIHEIPDESLDFVYIDGDHTLRGITIDLIKAYSKLRVGGCIGGDDFTKTIWQHHIRFEPTLVFPFAVYFAEAMDARIYALPFNQYLIERSTDSTYAFLDFTGEYHRVALQSHFTLFKILTPVLNEKFPFWRRIKRKIRKLKHR
ncbi:MAG: class I SAM-dependent methyltransferase [Candidatus Binatia bacterium]